MNTFNIKQFFIDNYQFVKNEWIVFIAALVAPTAQMLILIGLLIFTDTLSGIWGSIKTGGWKAFKSRILSLGILPKLIFYPLAIIMAQAMESQFPIIPAMKTTGFLLMSIEVKSIGENYKLIFGKPILSSLKDMLLKYTKTFNSQNPKK